MGGNGAVGRERAHVAGEPECSGAFVEVGRGPGGGPARFSSPSAVVCAREPGEVPAAFAAIDDALAAGRWIAGYVSYELGMLLEPRLATLMPEGRRLPLLEIGVFDAPGAAVPAAPGGRLDGFAPAWDLPRYRSAFDRVAAYIRAGDIYQANLTFPLIGRWSGDPGAIAAALDARQTVGEAALVRLPGATIVSRSPELFFALDGAGGIETRPMKGTAPRLPDREADRAARAGLAGSVKNRAENLMIVDLLRNDIGRICQIGSVEVRELFAVESYATVHQMVSRVAGHLRPGVGLVQALRALFPCGSITGAPKVRAMEIIRELEAGPRGAYCGAIGWAAPDGRARFNVAIRTLVLYPGGEAVLNVGGGVVADSTAEAEYEEALWKARFATTLPPA